MKSCKQRFFLDYSTFIVEITDDLDIIYFISLYAAGDESVKYIPESDHYFITP